jgi:hypothetical protein
VTDGSVRNSRAVRGLLRAASLDSVPRRLRGAIRLVAEALACREGGPTRDEHELLRSLNAVFYDEQGAVERAAEALSRCLRSPALAERRNKENHQNG